MNNYLIEFDNLEWESPIKGIRHKYFSDGKQKIRLVEYSQEMELHWCENGHIGLILEGEFEGQEEIENEEYLHLFCQQN